MGYNPFDYVGTDKRKRVSSKAMDLAQGVIDEHKLREKIREIMEVNYFGTMNCINAVYNYYNNKKSGQISIISSVVFTFKAFSLKTYTPPAISSAVSPLIERFTKKS